VAGERTSLAHFELAEQQSQPCASYLHESGREGRLELAPCPADTQLLREQVELCSADISASGSTLGAGRVAQKDVALRAADETRERDGRADGERLRLAQHSLSLSYMNLQRGIGWNVRVRPQKIRFHFSP